jgi:hypothetical protein
MTRQASTCDPAGADDKLPYIEIWLDHYMSGPSDIFSFLAT